MVRRQRSQWGNLEYDPVRKVARVRYWCTTDKGYRRVSKSFRNVASRMDAERIRAQLMLDHSEDAPCPTISQAWERWLLPELQTRLENEDLAAHTMEVYGSSWNVHVRPRWGDVPCDAVTALDVQQWLLDGMTLTQAKGARLVLSMLLDRAVKFGAIPANVTKTKLVMPSKRTVATKDKGTWRLSELGAVWKCVKGTPIAPAFLLAAFGSCRVGESLGVMSEDVEELVTPDGKVALARICRQVSNGGKVSETLKTESSRRTIVMPGNAGAELVSIAAEDGWLCSDGCGGVISQQVLQSRWNSLVPDDIRHPFRNLRNSWETYCRWELGMPPWCSEPLMGHAGKDVTGRYYDRPHVEQQARVVAKAWADWIAAGNVDPITR